MARIKFIQIETYKSGDPLDLSLITFRFLRTSDTKKQRAANPLGEFTQSPKSINQSYDYEKGVSVALYDGDGDQVGQWQWVNDEPTGRRHYLTFKRDGGLFGTDCYYKILYEVHASASPQQPPATEKHTKSAGVTEAAAPRHASGSGATAPESRDPVHSTNRTTLRPSVVIHKRCIYCDAAMEAFASSNAFRSLTVAALIRCKQRETLH